MLSMALLRDESLVFKLVELLFLLDVLNGLPTAVRAPSGGPSRTCCCPLCLGHGSEGLLMFASASNSHLNLCDSR